MNTRRYPRTLQEAFGPHTSVRIEEPRDPNERTHWVLYALAVIAVLAILRATQ